MSGIKEKRCSKCRIVKTAADFGKDKHRPDGLLCQCKECKRDYERAYRKMRREGGDKARRTHNGIDSWSQVGSVLREMAELQSTLNAEKAACEKRIAMIREYSEEIIDPCLCRQLSLQIMLQNFLKKNCAKSRTTRKEFRFGSLHFCRGKMDIELNVEFATKRRGKP